MKLKESHETEGVNQKLTTKTQHFPKSNRTFGFFISQQFMKS